MEVLPAVIIGGVAYTLVKQQGEAKTGGQTNYQTSFGNTTSQQLTGVPKPPVKTGQTVQTGSLTSKLRMVNAASVNPLAPKTNWTYADQHNNIDPELAQKLAYIEQQAKEQFDNLNEVAKAEAADQLNKELKLDPPLNGHEDWKTVASVAGGAAGAIVGGYFGGPLGAKIGALVGAYLGVKLEELIAKNYADMKAWCVAKWGKLKQWVEEEWDDIKDAAGDALDWINPF